MNNNKRLIIELKKKYQNELKQFIDDAQDESIKFFKKSFDNKGFTDETLIRWKRRKKQQPWGLLNKTGTLKNSIRKLSKTKLSFSVGTTLSYASYHNDGTNRLPKRQFIGDSRKLMRILGIKLYRKIYKLL